VLSRSLSIYNNFSDIFSLSRSLVGFGIKQRAIGEAAKTQETSNFKNTIGSLKRLIGRTLNDPDVQEVEKKYINASLVDVSGSVGVQVCACIKDYPQSDILFSLITYFS
jgi:molecular chaperone DnaK (HSP70)